MRRTILTVAPLALAVLAGCREQELPTELTPASASHAAIVGSMIDLGTLPGGTWSFASGINNRGEIVRSGDSADGEERAFLWQNGTMIDLGPLPGGAFTSASGINNRGQIVGSVYDEDFSSARAFLWQNGTMIDLGTLGGPWSSATAINDRGEVVGFSSDVEGSLRAFLWRNGTMTELEMLPGGHNSQALGTNSRGQVAGFSGIAFVPGAVTERAVLWYKGEVIELGVLPSTAFFTLSFAHDVNDGGQVAGWEERPSMASTGLMPSPGRTASYDRSRHAPGRNA
jgi:probable HAF family extracellular repeat protein